MTLRRLTAEWSIDVDESFKSRVVDQDLQLLSLGPPVRTIWVAVWSPPTTQTVDQIVETIRVEMRPDPTARFDEPGWDDGERRLGSWYPESVDGRMQWGLYGYTIRVGSYVQSAFLVDDVTDLDWAVGTWRSLRFA